MESKPKILTNSEYQLFETIQWKDFNSFLSNHNWKYSRLHLLYIAFSLTLLVLMICFIVASNIIIAFAVLYASLGAMLFLLLLPIHEVIHYSTFKILGAPKVKIIFLKKQYSFYTVAHHFPIEKKEMIWIALLPFSIITAFGIILICFASPPGQIILCSSILLHTSVSLSDFRILDYFLSNKEGLIMISDLKTESTYIMERSI